MATPAASSSCAGQKVVFRGANIPGLEFGTFFDNPYPGVEQTNFFVPRQADLVELKNRGFNIVRVPFEWARLVPGWEPGDPQPASLNPGYLSLLDSVVAMAAAQQLYVVIEMHDFLKYWSGQNDQECVDDDAAHTQLLETTWRLLAVHYGDNRAVLGYDLMNEPVRQSITEPCGSTGWPSIAQGVTTVVRTVDVNHLLFIEGPSFSLASRWPIENPEPFVMDAVEPPRLVYSPHVYFDAGDTSQYAGDESTQPEAKWPYYVRDRLTAVIDWSSEHNVPLLIGEVGVPGGEAWADVMRFAFQALLEPEKVSVTAWFYIDPVRCPLSDPSCALNLAHANGLPVLAVLSDFPGGVYETRQGVRDADARLISSPAYSRLYDDETVTPWNDASSGVTPDYTCANPVGMDATVCVDFTGAFANFKLTHHTGIDTRRFRSLRFSVYLTGAAQQNFKIYTTAHRPDSDPGEEPPYPAFENRPALRDFIGATPPGNTWLDVEIPLSSIVDPMNPIVAGIAFQSLAGGQLRFHLNDIVLTPFTEDIVRPRQTPIRARHFTELREHADAWRLRTGLPRFGWTDSTLNPGLTVIKAQHIEDLLIALGMSPGDRQGMLVQAAHLVEVRKAIYDAEAN